MYHLQNVVAKVGYFSQSPIYRVIIRPLYRRAEEMDTFLGWVTDEIVIRATPLDGDGGPRS